MQGRGTNGHVESKVDEYIVVRSSIPATDHGLIPAGQPAQHPALAELRIPAKSDARLEVVEIPARTRTEQETGAAAIGLHNLIVEGIETRYGVTRSFVAHAIGQGQGRLNLPGILPEEEVVVPPVVIDDRSPRQGLVDVGYLGNVVNEILNGDLCEAAPKPCWLRKGGIGQPAANRGHEKARDVDAPKVKSELHGVGALIPRKGVLELIGIVEAELRLVDSQSNGGSRDI